jgi:hydrogenase maturation protease
MEPIKKVTRTLIIGYGSIDRADDGVAYFVINALRQRIGQALLSEDETGMEDVGHQVDSIFLVQLAPELMDVLACYDQVVFVDAHVLENVDGLHCAPVFPEYTPVTFTHHIGPAMILALLKALYHREPTGHIVSIRGYNFDFHRNLSEATRDLVDPAVEYILQSLIYCHDRFDENVRQS